MDIGGVTNDAFIFKFNIQPLSFTLLTSIAVENPLLRPSRHFIFSFYQIKSLSIFDLINNENRLSRYETEEAVPKLKVTKQLIEEIYTASDPPARPKPCPIKPMRSAIK